jgi:hypothetical protein
MKELILFSVSILFIACQNYTDTKLIHPKMAKEPILVVGTFESQQPVLNEILRSESIEIGDWNFQEELAHPELPGIHYRPVALRSEPITEGLYCISRVSSDSEEDINVELLRLAEHSQPAKLASFRQ